MTRTNLPHHADIFLTKKPTKQLPVSPVKKSGKAGRFFKTAGMITSMAAVFLTVNLSGLSFDTVAKQVVDPAATVPNRSFFSMLPQTSFPQFNQVSVSQTPIPTTQPSFNSFAAAPTFNTPTFNVPTFNTPVAVPVINTPAGSVPITGTGSGINLAGAASQINQMQNQIVVVMQQCLSITQQAISQTTVLKQQLQQVDAAQNAYNNQLASMNSGDPAFYQLQSQRDQLTFQRQQINNAIIQVSNQATNSRSACQNQVVALQNQKRDAENQLNSSFTQALTTSIY